MNVEIDEPMQMENSCLARRFCWCDAERMETWNTIFEYIEVLALIALPAIALVVLTL